MLELRTVDLVNVVICFLWGLGLSLGIGLVMGDKKNITISLNLVEKTPFKKIMFYPAK